MIKIDGVSIVIPCLNEANTVSVAVKQAFVGLGKTGLAGEVLVMDNGSTDETSAQALAAGARVLHDASPGYGHSLDAGIRNARYECIVFADGDLSYPFDELCRLIQPILRNEADVVLGSRLKGRIEPGAMPWLHRWVGTPCLSLLIRCLYKIPTSDSTSGMRALRRSAYDRLNLRTVGMEFGAEMLVRVAQCQLRYQEVPIDYRRDQRGRPSHLRTYRDGYRFLRAIVSSA